jgi:hypothetical protein
LLPRHYARAQNLPAVASTTPAAQQPESPEAKPVVVPKKTEIVMSLLSFVTTRSASVGDKFYGQVVIPVTADDRIVIPVGSYVVGAVRHAKRAGRITGKAELALDFHTVIFSSGQTRNLKARVQTADGYKSESIQKSEGTIQGEPQKGKDVEEGARNASIGASLGSIIVGSSARSLRGVAYGGIGGAATGLGLTLLKRGADVELQRGTQLTLVLEQDIVLEKIT